MNYGTCICYTNDLVFSEHVHKLCFIYYVVCIYRLIKTVATTRVDVFIQMRSRYISGRTHFVVLSWWLFTPNVDSTSQLDFLYCIFMKHSELLHWLHLHVIFPDNSWSWYYANLTAAHHHTMSPYHLTGNGLMERFMWNLYAYYACFCQSKRGD